ncbi:MULTISPECIES: glutamyl-tRNA reductase [unclassified Actinotalea]|uniref:glutamyl-tRNA reductase n=1 Tax=unclassified Actinotalea TaxID=2638618 RepID=UPI00210458AC|nr:MULTISPECIES: glutamyl-tRNA reductase [unclassified Actinotalea]
MLLTLTASHRDLDLDVLEQLSSGGHSVGAMVVADSPDVTGCVVLATCNRFEVYLDVAAAPDDDAALADVARDAVDAVAAASGLAHEDVAASLQLRSGPAVPRHLFTVASGLDSMVVGEREVAGQVRRALGTARRDGTTSPTLERLFQVASRTSRAVGSQTGLGSAGRSVVGVALDLAGQAVDLSRARVLLIGTGSYAGASLTALRARGVTDVAVYSPSGRAQAFAADRGLRAVEAGGLGETLAEVDVVVSCSGALGPVVDAAMVAAARERSATVGAPRPTVLVDLALHHDIDPDVAHVPGVVLIDLAAVQRHSPTTVTPEVEAGLAIVEERVAELEATLAEQSAVPAVVALRSHVEQVLDTEVQRARAAARARGDEAGADLAERALRRFAAAMLHTPAVRAREHARRGRHAEYRDAVEVVFGVDVPRDGAPAVRADRSAPRHRAD